VSGPVGVSLLRGTAYIKPSRLLPPLALQERLAGIGFFISPAEEAAGKPSNLLGSI